MVTSQFDLIAANEAQAGVPGSTSPINLDVVAGVVAVRPKGNLAIDRVDPQRRLWKFGYMNCVALLVKDDPHYAELLYRAPRL